MLNSYHSLNFIWLKNKSQYFQRISFYLKKNSFWFQLMETKQKCRGWWKVFCLKISYSKWKWNCYSRKFRRFEPQKQVELGILMLLGHSSFICFDSFCMLYTFSLCRYPFHVATDSSQGIHFIAVATRKREPFSSPKFLKNWTVTDQARVKWVSLNQ